MKVLIQEKVANKTGFKLSLFINGKKVVMPENMELTEAGFQSNCLLGPPIHGFLHLQFAVSNLPDSKTKRDKLEKSVLAWAKSNRLKGLYFRKSMVSMYEVDFFAVQNEPITEFKWERK
jgi:hypothetical protein